MDKSKLNYTESARAEIKELHKKLDRDILSSLLAIKYYPGVNSIEVNQSDIEKIKLAVPDYVTKSNKYGEILSKTYIGIGILVIGIGLGYDTFVRIIENTIQAALILGGVIVLAIGWFLNIYVRHKAELARARFYEALRSQYELYNIIENNTKNDNVD